MRKPVYIYISSEVYKVASPSPWGDRIKLLGKKIKSWEEGKGRGKKGRNWKVKVREEKKGIKLVETLYTPVSVFSL